MDASLESKAMSLLEAYEGGNNYLIELKRKSQINRRFYPTRSQSEYIINNHDKQPKVAKKWVILDAYFAQKLADDKLMTEIPEKVWVEKLLADKEKAFHIWGKITESEQLHDFWLPKAAIIKDNTVKDVIINYEKYSHRPPLEHQKEAIQKLVENKNILARIPLIKIGNANKLRNTTGWRPSLVYEDFVVQNNIYLRPDELKYLKGDSTEVREILKWKPEYTFETLINEMVEFWLNKLK
jgi:hypothetical protein